MNILKENKNGVSYTDAARDIMNLAYDDTPESKELFEKKIKAAQNDQMLRVAIIAHWKSVTKVAFTQKPVFWVKDILQTYGFI